MLGGGEGVTRKFLEDFAFQNVLVLKMQILADGAKI